MVYGVYFHKLIHDCHCHLKMWSIYARSNFLLLKWDCCKMEKCRTEGVNNICHGDICLLSIYCVLVRHPHTAHGNLTGSLIVLLYQVEMLEQSSYLSFAVTQRASQQPSLEWEPRATSSLSDCEGPACSLFFDTGNASSLLLGESGTSFSIWQLWCLYFLKKRWT